MDYAVPWHYSKYYYVVVQFLVVAALVEVYSSVIFGWVLHLIAKGELELRMLWHVAVKLKDSAKKHTMSMNLIQYLCLSVVFNQRAGPSRGDQDHFSISNKTKHAYCSHLGAEGSRILKEGSIKVWLSNKNWKCNSHSYIFFCILKYI